MKTMSKTKEVSQKDKKLKIKKSKIED